ncbi:MAG: bacteriohemerythrin [Patescibacteria group bacterium]
MPKYNWVEKYSVGVREIDKQHGHYFDMVNNIIKLTGQDNVSIDDLIPKINELCDYARYHFSTEENIFKKYSYLNIKEHMDAHEIYWEKMDQFILKAKTAGENTKKIAMEVAEFAGSWLINHIMMMDQKYIIFMHQNGIK